MFIETEDTPNPATLKFLPGRYVMEASTADFASPASAERSPLASALFDLPGVARVFLGGDFITVTKAGDIDWQALKPQVLAAIMDHFVAGRPVIEGAAEAEQDEDVAPEDQEIADQIKELLDTRVRPAVAGDGGDIVFRGYRDGIVRLHMQGSCSGCPSSRATLKHGIENMLRHYVPEVVGVEQVEL
jgi:NFU1 iron-sulfur cluster scaffold homolog, mitochondrial